MQRLWKRVHNWNSQLKVLILRDSENQLWLHIDRIQTIYISDYSNYYKLIQIKTIDGFMFDINDLHKENFTNEFNKFIESDRPMKSMKVMDLKISDDKTYAFMRIPDWVSQAKGV